MVALEYAIVTSYAMVMLVGGIAVLQEIGPAVAQQFAQLVADATLAELQARGVCQ